MAEITRVHRKATDTLISVGITDFSTGKNRVDLLPGTASGSTIIPGNGIMSNIPFFSEDIVTQDANVTHYFDLDFDLPQTIEGKTIVQLPQALVTAGAAGTLKTQVGFDISGSNTAVHKTLISGSTSSLSSAQTESVEFVQMRTIALEFPKTTFNSDTQLRFWYVNRVTGAGATGMIGHDPQGRPGGSAPNSISDVFSGSKVTTKLTLQTPFKINL